MIMHFESISLITVRCRTMQKYRSVKENAEKSERFHTLAYLYTIKESKQQTRLHFHYETVQLAFFFLFLCIPMMCSSGTVLHKLVYLRLYGFYLVDVKSHGKCSAEREASMKKGDEIDKGKWNIIQT